MFKCMPILFLKMPVFFVPYLLTMDHFCEPISWSAKISRLSYQLYYCTRDNGQTCNFSVLRITHRTKIFEPMKGHEISIVLTVGAA